MSANIEDFEYDSENADKDLFSGDDSDKDPDFDLSSYVKKMQGHLSDEEEHALPARKRPPQKKGLMYSNRYPVVRIGLRRMCAGGLILGSTSLLKVVILMRKKGNSRKKKWTVMKWQRIWRKIQTRLWKVMVSMMNWKKKCGRVLTYAF